MDELTRRLDALERWDRWLTRTVMLMALAFAALLAVGWKSPDGTVEAQELVVMDKDGKKRAWLGVDADGTPGLMLFGQDERVRAVLGVGPDGLTLLALDDANGKKHAELGVASDGTPGLVLSDKDGTPVWSAPPK